MRILRTAIGFVLRIAAGCIILLALLVGVARLVLPEVSTLTDDIKNSVRAATGFTIDFRFISAGVSIFGPELRLQGVTVTWPNGDEILSADRLAVSLDVIDSISYESLRPERIRVVGAQVDAELSSEGELFLQGRHWRELLPPELSSETTELPEFLLQLEKVGFSFRNLQREGPLINGMASRFELLLDDDRVELTADLAPGEELGRRLRAEAAFPLALVVDPDTVAPDTLWNLALFVEDVRLDPWLRLADLRDLPVIGSEGDAEARLEFRGKNIVAIQTDLDLEQVALTQPSGPPVLVDYIEGVLDWRLSNEGWLASGDGFSIGRDKRAWPDTRFTLRFAENAQAERTRYFVESNFLRIDDLLLLVRAIAPQTLDEAGIGGELQGDLNNLKAELEVLSGKPGVYSVQTDFSALGYVSPEQGLDLNGYTGSVSADEKGGDLSVVTRAARFGLSAQFRETLKLTALDGVAVWRISEQGYRVMANGVEVSTAHGAVTASMELNLDKDFGNPVVDINGEAQFGDIAEIPRYLPLILDEMVIDWLDQALIAGTVPGATYRLSGPLTNFPFDTAEGDFNVEVNFEDAVLDYAPEWPLLENMRGTLVFDRGSLYSDTNEFSIEDVVLTDTAVRIDDLREAELTAKGSAEADISEVITLLRASPVAEALGPVFEDVYASGDTTAELTLRLPILDIEQWEFDADFVLQDVTAGMFGIDPEITRINGRGSVDNIYVALPEATAVLLEDPVTLRVVPDKNTATTISHQADISGVLDVQRIWNAFGMPETTLIAGKTAIDAQALFPADSEDEANPFRVKVKSQLVGMASVMPFPLAKLAIDPELMDAVVFFPEEGRIDINGALRGFNWAVRMEEDNTGWFIERGTIKRGGFTPGLPPEPGVNVSAYLERLDLQAWQTAFSDDYWPPEGRGDNALDDWQQTFGLIDLNIDELFSVNHRFIDTQLQASPLTDHWDIKLTGPWVEGRVLLPFEYTGVDIMELDMQRLLLIESLEGEEDYTDDLDPREIPPIRGTIKDFALDTMRFGELELDVRRTPDGLKSALLRTRAPSFTTESSSDWLVIDNAQRTRLHMELVSNDFEETLKSLDYAPYMSAEKATVITDLLWEGAPDSRMLTESTGTVQLKIKDGIVNEVDAGGGRLLGLVSIGALPRRLSMDFTEITESGLIFDELKGSFRIDFGNAWTCDLGLEGDIADMGVVGRIGIREEDYDQLAIVRPHVSNLAPVAGVVLGGPAIGAATLLITQIFKKPLSGIGGTYFTITGTWDEPLVEDADSSTINTSRFSECEASLPYLSPEEIRAMQDLMKEETESKQPAPPRAKIGPVSEE